MYPSRETQPMRVSVPFGSPSVATKPDGFEGDHMAPDERVCGDPSREENRKVPLSVPRHEKIVGVAAESPRQGVRDRLLRSGPEVRRLDNIRQKGIPLQLYSPGVLLGVRHEGFHPVDPLALLAQLVMPVQIHGRATGRDRRGLLTGLRLVPDLPARSAPHGVSAVDREVAEC